MMLLVIVDEDTRWADTYSATAKWCARVCSDTSYFCTDAANCSNWKELHAPCRNMQTSTERSLWCFKR